MNIQKQNSQNVVKTGKKNTVISREPVASRSRGQLLEVIERKDPSAERKIKGVRDRADRS